jgi:hypothetical protein
MAIMEGGLVVLVSVWIPSNAVFSVPQFHESIWVARCVWGVFWGFTGG